MADMLKPIAMAKMIISTDSVSATVATALTPILPTKKMSTMPPPDDLEDRRREHKFYSRLSRGEIRNEHRYQTRSAFVFLLLVMGILALSFWIYSVLQSV